MGRKVRPLLFKVETTLGSLELHVMEVIWEKEKMTVRDVVEIIRHKKSIAYTTIMTVMDNLYKKGFVKRVKVKKTYHYFPKAPENLFVRSSVLKVFQNLISEYGKLMVLSSLVSVQVKFPMPKLSPAFAFYKIPATIGFLATLVLGLFTVSFWDLIQSLTFFGSVDYLKLVLSEPKIIFDHTNLIFGAFFESLPIANLLMNIILFIFAILIVRKMVKLVDFKFPAFFRMRGGLT